MKKIILLALFGISVQLSLAQTPLQIYQLQEKEGFTILSPGPKNVWTGVGAGAQATYNLANGEFIDNFQASGRALIEILGPKSDNFGLYLMGNLSRLSVNTDSVNPTLNVREILQSSQGINISLYPHYIWGEPDGVSFTLYANIGWKLNALRDNKDSSLLYVHQFRISPIAIELSGLKGFYSEYPTTLTFEPIISIISKSQYSNIFSQEGSYITGYNLTLILPAGKGKGILFDALFSKNTDVAFRVGLMLTGSI